MHVEGEDAAEEAKKATVEAKRQTGLTEVRVKEEVKKTRQANGKSAKPNEGTSEGINLVTL